MQTSGGSANQGGRGNRGIMAEVVAWRQEGQTEKDICDKLKATKIPGTAHHRTPEEYESQRCCHWNRGRATASSWDLTCATCASIEV